MKPTPQPIFGGHLTLDPGQPVPTEPPGTYDGGGFLILLIIGVFVVLPALQRRWAFRGLHRVPRDLGGQVRVMKALRQQHERDRWLYGHRLDKEKIES